ncbi:phage tail protein I [Sphingobium cloacae]|uniref:Phage tail protein n=1 Tax=Sphingobium cloacae TaxID=120107 RepID=A0A1E1F5G5_9SPHN|nr:phage tail protein I [Sphingobium cloacae]BAV65759.1 phage tail protein [Sphingobium cloacae]
MSAARDLLLPVGSTAFERAMAAAAALPFSRLSADEIAHFWNADLCPLPMLGHLAWQLSVDIWQDGWSESRKREVCRNALRLHRLKTTVAGIRAHLELVDADLLRVTRPPAKSWLHGALTAKELAAWRARLPQIRIYPFRLPSTADRRFYMARRGGWLDAGWLRPSRGAVLLGERAAFHDGGVDVPVRIERLDDGLVSRIFLKRHARRGRFVGAAWLQASMAARQVVTLRLDDAAPDFAAPAGMEPIDIRPLRVSEGRFAPRSLAFGGRFGGYLAQSHGPLMLFDCVYLHAPDRAPAMRKARSWYGVSRLGMSPYSAELKVRVPMRRPRQRAARWLGQGHVMAADLAPLHRAMEAVRVSKALRDTILIDTATRAPVRFGAGLKFGEFTFGENREIV